MTNYAGRYGSGPQIKPGSLTLALVATALPIVALVTGLQINQIIRDRGKIDVFNVPKELPPPPPDQVKKVPPKAPQQEKIYVPPVPLPPVPQTPQVDLTPVRPADPPSLGPVGKAPDPAPPALPDPIKPPVIVGAQVSSMGALQPPYPPDMLRAQQEGRVVVRVLIGPDGRVKQVEKVSATTDSFYAATEKQALGRWRFKPATKDGVPFDQWKTMSLRFELNGE